MELRQRTHGLLAAILLAACAPEPAPPELDDPLPGLTADQLARFEQGEELFESAFTPAQGLGPLFNAEGCVACHNEPTDAGAGPIRELHVSGIGAEGTCDALFALGGPVIQQRATPSLEAFGILAEPVPVEATARGERSTPDLFGFGLLDAIPDATILALADPDDRDGDGVSGRAHLLPGGHVGRFGRKAVVASLAQFNEGAFLLEMGLTTPANLVENSLAGEPLPPGVDPLPEPEVTAEAVARVDDYVRFLAPPAPGFRSHEALRGQVLFERVGCATCHVPRLVTGEHVVRALAHQPVHAYTDLLLHDMGSELADLCLLDASPSEFRTEPLMGLRHMTRFLHDGRAPTVLDAILAHGGEGTRARDAFTALGETEREALLAFLGTL
ncbi:MAG TPA: di-heme oxidoredictase family protein [Planctomycetota bacterium]